MLHKEGVSFLQGIAGGSRGEEGVFTCISQATRGPHVIFGSTFAFVLVLAAVGNAVLALTIWWRLTRALASHELSTSQRFNSYATTLRAVTTKLSALTLKAPESLAAEVADLREAVSRLRATHQRFAGRFDAQRPGKVFDGATGEPVDTDDDEIAAMVGLQQAPPGKPTNGAPQ